MLFNSIQFIIFLPIVVGCYFFTPIRYRWLVLLSASYYFYMSWRPEYVVVIIASTVMDYYIAHAVYRATDPRTKKRLLGVSILLNLTVLFTFKYITFFSETMMTLARLVSIELPVIMVDWVLPLGISFYTFQTMSYTIDVYRGRIVPEKKFGLFALYVSFFPQLIAGPIERAAQLLPQLQVLHGLQYDRFEAGVRLILWGMFKKIVIADRIAVYVDRIFAQPDAYSGPYFVTATVLFGFQLYCDFSGYSDIAIGCAKIFGIDLVNNFKQPFFADSVADFWRRWHISLSTWFQDYVFTPLYVQCTRLRILRSVPARIRHIIVFTIAIMGGEALLGLWHGAQWTFVLFGLYFGILIAGYYMVRTWFDGLPRIVRIASTFVITSGSWLLFRAQSVSDVWYILQHMGTQWSQETLYEVATLFGYKSLALVGLMMGIVLIVHLNRELQWRWLQLPQTAYGLRWSLFAVSIFFILLFGTFGGNEFVYFTF